MYLFGCKRRVSPSKITAYNVNQLCVMGYKMCFSFQVSLRDLDLLCFSSLTRWI